MKKYFRFGIGTLLMLVIFLSTGCTNIKKYNALMEYEESLSLDIVYYDQFEITTKQVLSSSSYKEQMAYLGIMEENVKHLKENAELRNSLIEDSEVKEIDDCYVKAISDIYNSYKVVREGIYEGDEKKYQTGLSNMENSLDSFSKFIDKLESYTLRYDIKMEDVSGIKDEISVLKELY